MSKPLLAIKARFDGRRVILPAEAHGVPPGDVIVVFEQGQPASDTDAWMKASEPAFAQAWDNEDDAVYDAL